MFIVIDANELFSAMISKKRNLDIILNRFTPQLAAAGQS